MALTPYLIYRSHGARLNQAGLNTFAAVFFYAMGWVLLRVALTRDPHGDGLKTFLRSTAARLSLWSALLFLQFIGLALSTTHMMIVLLGFGMVFFALWAKCRTGEALTKAVENSLLLVGSLGFILIVGEMFCRHPVVVARTGGNTPGMARWAEQNYDHVSDQTPMGVRSFHTDQKAKPAGVFRIVTLGDSFTWGSKIGRTEDLWPYALERLLNKKDRPVQVINLGRPGFTTVNEAEMLDKMGWQYDPDLVIHEFTLNDTIPSGPNFFHESEDWYFRLFPLVPVFHKILDDRSYLYSFLNAGVRSLQMRLRYADGYAPLFGDDFSGWKDCQNAIRNMAEQTKKRNVPMLGVIFPLFIPGNLSESTYLYADAHRLVRQTMEQFGVPVLDLRAVYAQTGRDAKSWWALPCDWHPSVEGHQVAAEAMAKKLGELGLIRSTPEQE